VGLPTELLVKILSYLPTRDKFNMRYVSQRLRDVSKVSFLWNEFVWADYEPHHIFVVCEILLVYGKNMRRILFPGYEAPVNIIRMVHYCKKVKHLSLPKNTQLSLNDLEKIVHTMPHLQQLDVFITEKFIQRIPSLRLLEGFLKVTAASVRELTLQIDRSHLYYAIRNIESWAKRGNLLPSIINILSENEVMSSNLYLSWSTSYSNFSQSFEIVLYDIKRVPMNLYPPMPLKKLYYGQRGGTLPLVQLSNYGILGLKHDIFYLNDYDDNGTVRLTAIPYGKRCQIEQERLNKISHLLYSVSYVDLSNADVLPHNLEQLAIACPNLQRLNLMENINCLKKLYGLQAIVCTCVNLQGLNLAGISMLSMESPHLHLWGLLSSLKKLTHLAINLCVLNPSDPFDGYRKEFINKFKICHSLQALEIHCCDRIYCCRQKNKDYLFSYFPSLTYCRMIDFPYYPGLVHAINNCHQLKYLYEESEIRDCLPHVLPNNCHLQQLYIKLPTDLTDKLVNTLSVHGRLECVFLLVESITFSGIITLIKNSPNLILLCISIRKPLINCIKNYGSYEDKVKKMFSYHKLFAVGSFKVNTSNSSFIADLFNTDLNSLWWPPPADKMFMCAKFPCR